MQSTTSNTRDTRAINDGSSPLPTTIALAVKVAGAVLGTLAIPQAKRLSGNGNVTYSGGIRRGWTLEGEILAVLSSLSFVADDVELKMAQTGVHASKTVGNTTVCHTGVVDLDNGEGTTPYMVQVYATHTGRNGKYNLSLKAFPQATNVGGPQIVGEVEGDFVIE